MTTVKLLFLAMWLADLLHVEAIQTSAKISPREHTHRLYIPQIPKITVDHASDVRWITFSVDSSTGLRENELYSATANAINEHGHTQNTGNINLVSELVRSPGGIYCIAASGKLSREKIFMITILTATCDSFLHEILGMPHPCSLHSVKVFSVKINAPFLPIRKCFLPRRFPTIDTIVCTLMQ